MLPLPRGNQLDTPISCLCRLHGLYIVVKKVGFCPKTGPEFLQTDINDETFWGNSGPVSGRKITFLTTVDIAIGA